MVRDSTDRHVASHIHPEIANSRLLDLGSADRDFEVS
jgi:hypothetical protein